MIATKNGKAIAVRVIAVGVIAGGLYAVPTTSWSAVEPEPVTPKVQTIPIRGVDKAAEKQAPKPTEIEDDHGHAHSDDEAARKKLKPAVVTEAIETEVDFGLVGVTFDEAPPRNATVQVRVKEDDAWSDWVELPHSKGHGPDQGDPDFEAVRNATEPLLTNPANEVQVRVDTPDGKAPKGTQVSVIESTSAPADSAAVNPNTPGAVANAATAQPPIISRAAWGANEKLRGGCPGNNSVVKVAFVHHTAGASGNKAADIPGILRNLYSWATSNGYCDMPYNFLADKFGNIYEGRGGGITAAVKSGATASFNKDSVSIAAIGNFSASPSTGFNALNRAVAQLVGWKLSLYGRDAAGTEALIAEGYPGGVPKGESRTFNRVSGHRDAFPTACPGDAFYPQLAAIRTVAASGQSFTGRVDSTITQWAKSKRKRKNYYRSSFVVSPGPSRTVNLKAKRPGKRWKNGKKWKIALRISTDETGYGKFKIKARKKVRAYRLVAPSTDTAKWTRNGVMRLVKRSRR